MLRKSLAVSRVLTALLALLFIGGCVAVGSMVAKMMTQKTDDLSTAAVQVRFIRNLYPAATQTTEVKYLKDMWPEGGNMVVINFQKREGIGMYSIDGKVFIDGEEVPHTANGFYGKIIDADDLSPKKIVVETTSGQRAEFTVAPTHPIEIAEVNGTERGGEVNLEQDLQLKINNPQGSENTEFRVAFLSDIMGTRSFQEVGVFRSADDITIPAAVFRNPGTAVSPNDGENYLLVERFELAPYNVEGVGAAQVIAQSMDCVPVNISGEVEESWVGTIANSGIRVNEEIENERGKLTIDMNKPNAFLGRPFSSGKKFAMVSFTVRATKLKQSRSSTSTSEATYGNTRVTTTTTTTQTRQFPKLPDSYWEELVNSLYADFEKTLLSNYNIELIPVEQVLQAESYSDLEPIDDNITVVEVEKSYKGTRNLIPTTMSAIMNNISSTYASDRIDSRLIRELGVDGIIAVTIDLEMPWEEFTLSPRMSIRISGPPNGYIQGPTIYTQGVIFGNGVELEEAKMNAGHVMDVLPEIIRKDDLMMALQTGFDKMAEMERDADYEAIWALK